MRVSLLQFRSELGAVDENFKRAARLINRSLIEKPDVIILPELWSTGFYPKPPEEFADSEGQRTCEFLSTAARNNHVNIVGGTVLVRDGDRLFNRNCVFDRNGECIALYDKIHLFSMSKENEVFTAGNSLVHFDIDGVKCSVIVCYDLRFPETARRLALDGAELLFIPAAWPLRRLEHWRILTRARAIENQFFVAAVNGAGHSMLINPWGEVLLEGDSDEAVLTSEIDLNARKKIGETMNVFADRNALIDRV